MKSQKGSTQYRPESCIVDHLYQQDPHLTTHIMPSSTINLKIHIQGLSLYYLRFRTVKGEDIELVLIGLEWCRLIELPS